jgi:hypothetical protein
MNLERASELERLIGLSQVWPVTVVPFDLCMDPSSDETTTVNLAHHIGPDSTDEEAIKNHHSCFMAHIRTEAHLHCHTKYCKMYLPPQFHTNDTKTRKQVIIPLISNAFGVDGGGVVSKGWEGEKNKLIFQCIRGRVAKSQKKGSDETTTSTKSINTTTARPTCHDSTCYFTFSLYWEPAAVPADNVSSSTKGRWYFYQNGPGCRFHSGHIRKEKDEIKKRSNLVDPLELDIASDGMDVNLSTTAMGALLYKRTDTNLDRNQLRYQHQKRQAAPSGGNAPTCEKKTPADKLIDYLENADNISYVILLANAEDGRDLLTIPKERSKKITLKTVKGGHVNVANAILDGAVAEISTNIENIAEGETPKDTANAIFESLLLSDGAEVLLAAAWVSDDGRRLHTLFPEWCAGDVIMKTNSEKRPYMRLAGKTSSNETFSSVNSFIPSQARWSFDWFHTVATPALLGERFLQRNCGMGTDGDDKLYDPFTANAGPGRLYPNSRHRLCAFHKFRQGPKGEGFHGRRSGLSDEGKNCYRAVEVWMYSWTDNVESEDELNMSFCLLKKFLRDPKVREALTRTFARDIENHIVTKVWAHRHLFSHHVYHGRRIFGNRTSNNAEVEGAVLKNHEAGPKPCDNIAKAAKATNTVTDMRLTVKKQRTATAMDSMPVVINDMFAPLYQKVTSYAAEKVISNWQSTHKYAIYRKHHDEFYVKALKYKKFQDNMSDREEYCKFVTPRYQRTRRVFVRQHVSGQLYLTCSCLCYEGHGYGCQHIFAVLGRSKPPSPNDVVIRWHKSYDRLYMKGDENIDCLFDDLFENELPGPAVVSVDSIKNFRSDIVVGHGEKPLSFFMPTLPGKTPVLQPGIKWSEIVKNNAATMVQQQQQHCSQMVPSSSGGVLRQMLSLSQHVIASQANDQQGTQKDDSDDDSTSSEFFGVGQSNFDDGDGDDITSDIQADTSVLADKSVLPEKLAVVEKSALVDELPDKSVPVNESALMEKSARLDAVQQALKKSDAFSLIKPRLDRLAGLAGKDPSMVMEIQDTLAELEISLLRQLAAKQPSAKVQTGIVSLPATDAAKQSKRIPTGNATPRKGKNKKKQKKKQDEDEEAEAQIV